MEFSLKYVSYEKEYLVNALEAVLFAGGDPVSVEKLALLFDITKVEVDIVANALDARLSQKDSSFELCRLGDMLQLCTKKEYADPVQKYLEIKRTSPISIAALEALSIVAYKQPITRQEIEAIRGVSCDHAVNKLVEYSLIAEVGRLDAPGRPILFGTTEDFLRSFGLASLEELPIVKPEKVEDFKIEAEEEIQLKLDI